jgi:TolB-like protein
MRYHTAGGVISDLKRLGTPSQSSISSVPAKKKISWTLAVGGLVIIAMLIMAGIKYWPGVEVEWQAAPLEERILLAVLPFENIGAPEDEYFADGITGEITSKVNVLDGLGVMARTSVLQYKRTTKRISEIGAELNVDFLLGGSIRWDKTGSVDKIRITPELIRVSDETTVWTDNIQRNMDGVFDVQAEIATSIAEALNVTLLAGGQEALDYRPTENLDAYDYYLRANNYGGPGGALKAIELLNKAIELDSTFALAFAMKSVSHSFFAFLNESGFSEHTRPARQAYKRAFEIQPDLAAAHLARGVYYNLIERDYDKALREFELARKGHVEEAWILGATAMVKLRQGKWNEAIALSEQAIQLDPQSRGMGMTIFQACWYTHQYEKALKVVERLGPPNTPKPAWTLGLKARIQICMGANVEQIQQTLSEWFDMGPNSLGGVSPPIFLDFLRSRNQLPDLDTLISRMKSRLQRNPDPKLYVYIGHLYRYKGDKESSYLYLDSALKVTYNRDEEARRDTTGRFEALPPNHEVLEMLAMVYSRTERHEQAIEQAQLALESMPVEACHW